MKKNYYLKIIIFIIINTLVLYLIGCNKKNPDNQNDIIESKKPDIVSENNSDKNEVPDNKEQDKIGDSPAKEEKKKEPVKAKAVYITGSTAGSGDTFSNIMRIVKETELNAVVLDIKDESGQVNYLTDNEKVKKIGAYESFYDVKKVISKLHENNIYVIGRVVCFKDQELAKKRIDLAIKNKDGSVYRENGKTLWLNPYNKETWEYVVSIGKDAIENGFDEIQFDYVRFPAVRDKDVYYGENQPKKETAISGFLDYAYKELKKYDVSLSADIFGIVCESKVDSEAIGQNLEQIVTKTDYICPMVYPSHYANKSKGIMGNGEGQIINGVHFTAPDLEPYKVVYNTLAKLKERTSDISSKARVRPYLQDFTASYLSQGYYQKYGADQVKAQIKAVYDAGYEEWILWDSNNTYTEGALEK